MKFCTIEDNYAIKHLSEEDKYRLIEEYYRGASVKGLKREFGILAEHNKFHLSLPVLIDRELICPFCGLNLIVKLTSKSVISNEKREAIFYGTIRGEECRVCGHTVEDNCECENCKKILRHYQNMTIVSRIKSQINNENLVYEYSKLYESKTSDTVLAEYGVLIHDVIEYFRVSVYSGIHVKKGIINIIPSDIKEVFSELLKNKVLIFKCFDHDATMNEEKRYKKLMQIVQNGEIGDCIYYAFNISVNQGSFGNGHVDDNHRASLSFERDYRYRKISDPRFYD